MGVSIQEIIDTIKSMSVLEFSEMHRVLQEEYGLKEVKALAESASAKVEEVLNPLMGDETVLSTASEKHDPEELEVVPVSKRQPSVPEKVAPNPERREPKFKEIPQVELKQKHTENGIPEFPTKTSPNPQRRAIKDEETAQEAILKKYEILPRSVRTSQPETKAMARFDLQDSYTNANDEMVCQVCQKEMPFRKPDSTHYFEAVQFIKDLKKEYPQNYLALCPTCAAKFNHAIYTSIESLRKEVETAETLELPIILAREACTILFVETHLLALKAMLKVARQGEQSPGDS